MDTASKVLLAALGGLLAGGLVTGGIASRAAMQKKVTLPACHERVFIVNGNVAPSGDCPELSTVKAFVAGDQVVVWCSCSSSSPNGFTEL